MNRRKNFFVVVSVLLAGSSVSQADIFLGFTTTRVYRQAIDGVPFREGVFGVLLWDGNWVVEPCAGNGGAVYMGPSIICPLGTTAFLVGGDADSDGVRDDFTYWSVSSVIPAAVIEPNLPGGCSLYSAPPSKLPRPIGAFIDMTDTLYYDIQTEAVTEYRLPEYVFGIDYATRNEMDQQIVTGRYEFAWPRLGAPEDRVMIPVQYYPIPEGRIKRSNVWQGFSFTKLNGRNLIWEGGFVRMDPRVGNLFEWQGNNADTIFPSADTLYMDMSRLEPAPVGDPTRPIIPGDTFYPGFVAPGTSRVLLANPLVHEGVIPPGMIPIAGAVGSPPDGEAMLRVALERVAPTSTVAYDLSSRTYELPITFANTYEGWAAVRFPIGTPSSVRAAGGDPDGDGFTNFQEWPANTDPMNPASKPGGGMLAFVQGRVLRSTGTSGSGYWETKHPKVINAYPEISYDYEFSSDLKNWRIVGGDDPEWELVNSDTEIKIRSRAEKLSGQGFLRLKMTQAAPSIGQSVE
ncbi:MAG: hypothetical protein K9N23_09405 [Akkermansiaceae bacterium]|nr:hypothetical protein [Akkermansiaceae bacterium]